MKVKNLDFSSEVVVKLEDEKGGLAEIVFEEMDLVENELRWAAIKEDKDIDANERTAKFFDIVADSLKSISGLKQDGKEVTVEQVRKRKVYGRTMAVIMGAYAQRYEEAEEKKEEAAEES